MGEHNNLVPHPALRAHMERLAVASDQNDEKPVTKPTVVSVFGRSRTTRALATIPSKPFDRHAFNAEDPMPVFSTSRTWESLNIYQPSPSVLTGNKLFPQASPAPVAAIFDILRTRMLQALSERGWRRVGITSPTPDCGKSFVAANLALSFARRPSSRSVLIDLDLRKTDLAHSFGLRDLPPLAEFLSGDQPLESMFYCFGKTLALGLNGQPESDPGAILHSPETGRALEAMLLHLEPEVVLYDLPPALGRDDVLSLKPHLDAVLVVTDGRHSSPAEIRACEAMLQDHIPILGVVLNRGEDAMPGMKG